VSPRRIAVTGATGFIGRAVMRRLARERDLAVLGVSHRGGHVDSMVVDAVDLEDRNAVDAWAEQRVAPGRLDGIIHLAARVPASFGSEDATASLAANRRMTENVLALARTRGGAVVYASSSSVYGPHAVPPVTEQTPACPDNPYSSGKLSGEDLLASARQDGGIPSASLRIAAPYGPGQPIKTVIHYFVEAASHGRDLNVYGSGSRTQDFTFVEDVAEACWLALERGAVGTFNVSGGQPVTMRELAELAVASVGPGTSRIVVGSQPDPQEQYRGVFSIEKARLQLGFEPKVSLRDGLSRCAVAIGSVTVS
jgi:nucleoside-diphosphate-sugar epimerase